MIYDGTKQLDQNRAKERLLWLIKKGKQFEIKEKRKRRTISQNNYLHLIISWYAVEYGETAEYIKTEVFKKQLNRDLFLSEFINKKTGEVRERWKSTSELNTLEMTTAIDRFRNYSSKEAGIYLPEPSDLALINSMEIELSKQNQQYL